MKKTNATLNRKRLELKRAILRQLTTDDLGRADGGHAERDCGDYWPWPRPCGNPIYSA